MNMCLVNEDGKNNFVTQLIKETHQVKSLPHKFHVKMMTGVCIYHLVMISINLSKTAHFAKFFFAWT